MAELSTSEEQELMYTRLRERSKRTRGLSRSELIWRASRLGQFEKTELPKHKTKVENKSTAEKTS